MKRTEEKIVKWIQQKVKESNTKGIVIGLSGGIDSSVVAVLAMKAVGRKNVLGVIMPCLSNPQDEKDALALAKRFQIPYELVDLHTPFAYLMGTLPMGNNLATANLKPRLRMTTLYFFANLHNSLVAGTDNKTESMTGYFTKYGDGGVDILPITELFKRDVRKLARHLNIPKNIITKPPSAGLWEGQTDEKEMNMSYNELDDILYVLDKYGEKDIAKVINMVKRSEHKRQVPPGCKL